MCFEEPMEAGFMHFFPRGSSLTSLDTVVYIAMVHSILLKWHSREGSSPSPICRLLLAVFASFFWVSEDAVYNSQTNDKYKLQNAFMTTEDARYIVSLMSLYS